MIEFKLFFALVSYYFVMFATPGPNNAMLTASGIKFGFFNMIGKYAAIIGPPLMGYVGLVTGNPRLGIVSIIILFIAGGLLLTRVDIEEGERMANEVL